MHPLLPALIQLQDVVVPLAGITLGGLVLLVPLVGLTARFAVKPLLDAWAEARTHGAPEQRLQMLEQRIALLEQEVEHVQHENRRLIEEADFAQRLGAGR